MGIPFKYRSTTELRQFRGSGLTKHFLAVKNICEALYWYLLDFNVDHA